MGVYEVIEVDDGLRDLIHNERDEQEIKRYLRRGGWRSLREQGLHLVESGLSTLEEVLRVTHTDTKDEIRAEQSSSRDRAAAPASTAGPARHGNGDAASTAKDGD
jgi:hypothetical protein